MLRERETMLMAAVSATHPLQQMYGLSDASGCDDDTDTADATDTTDANDAPT